MPSYVVPPEKVAFYRAHGWVVLEDFVSPAEVARLRGICCDMISGKIDTRRNRADLGAHADAIIPGHENIIQVRRSESEWGWSFTITGALHRSVCGGALIPTFPFHLH